jgi:hypothetical protein
MRHIVFEGVENAWCGKPARKTFAMGASSCTIGHILRSVLQSLLMTSFKVCVLLCIFLRRGQA